MHTEEINPCGMHKVVAKIRTQSPPLLPHIERKLKNVVRHDQVSSTLHHFLQVPREEGICNGLAFFLASEMCTYIKDTYN